MRNYLIIGEVARLSNMSTSQIRFYEKHHLIEPKLINESGYRLYDYDQLNRLVVINQLRELNMPISEIREFLNNSQTYNDRMLLEKIKVSLQQDIKKMLSKLQQVENKLSQYSTFEDGNTALVDIKERTLHIIEENKPNIIQPKEVYDFINQHNLDYMDPNAEVFEVISSTGNRKYCFYHKNNDYTYTFGRYILPAGKYFSMNMKIDNINQVDTAFDEFERTAVSLDYELYGDKVIIQDLNRVVYSSRDIHITLQKLVRNKKLS